MINEKRSLEHLCAVISFRLVYFASSYNLVSTRWVSSLGFVASSTTLAPDGMRIRDLRICSPVPRSLLQFWPQKLDTQFRKDFVGTNNLNIVPRSVATSFLQKFVAGIEPFYMLCILIIFKDFFTIPDNMNEFCKKINERIFGSIASKLLHKFVTYH